VGKRGRFFVGVLKRRAPPIRAAWLRAIRRGARSRLRVCWAQTRTCAGFPGCAEFRSAFRPIASLLDQREDAGAGFVEARVRGRGGGGGGGGIGRAGRAGERQWLGGGGVVVAGLFLLRLRGCGVAALVGGVFGADFVDELRQQGFGGLGVVRVGQPVLPAGSLVGALLGL